MIKHAIEQVLHIEQYGIISLLIFFVFFTGMLCWAFGLKRDFLDSMGQLPLDHSSDHPQKNLVQHD